MDKKSIFSLCCFLFMVIAIQGCSSKLSEQEALELIRKKFKYPQVYPIELKIKGGTALSNYIDSLIEDGCLNKHTRENVSFNRIDETYTVTPKCDNLIENNLIKIRDGSIFNRQYVIAINGFTKDVKAIDEILTDSKRGIANVTYFVESKPTEYLKKLNSIDNLGKYQSSGYRLDDVRKIKKKRNTFKKWDDGWRL